MTKCWETEVKGTGFNERQGHVDWLKYDKQQKHSKIGCYCRTMTFY